MLVIRREQIKTLTGIARLDYEDSLLKHFRRFYPVESKAAGPEQVRKLIQYGAGRALVHGYETQREVGLYVNLMLMLGCDFDRDPLVPWAAEQLNDLAIEDPFARIQRVFRTATEYLGKTSGEGNAYLLSALKMVQEFDLGAAPLSSGLQLEADLAALLETVYPEKFAANSRAEITAFLRQTGEAAWDYGLTRPPGRLIYTALAFFLGIGISRDPMYRWVGQALAATEAERSAALYRESIAYLHMMLTQQ